MKKIVTVGILSLLLLGCNSDDRVVRLDKIEQVSLEIDSISTHNDSLLIQISLQSTELSKVKDSINNPNLETFQVNRDQRNRAYSQLRSRYVWENTITPELLWGDSLSILRVIAEQNNQMISPLRSYFATNKGETNVDFSMALSKNSKETHKYFFEYLGDLAGLHMGLSGDKVLLFSFIQKLSFSDRMRLVDRVTSQIFVILEHHWSSEEERELLINALEYVLETTREVDYRAVVIGNTFENDEYETNWNGVQKFFYRTEKKLPGTTSQLRVLIRKRIDRLTVELEKRENSVTTVVEVQ